MLGRVLQTGLRRHAITSTRPSALFIEDASAASEEAIATGVEEVSHLEDMAVASNL